MKRIFIAYFLIILIFGLGVHAIIVAGKKLEATRGPAPAVQESEPTPTHNPLQKLGENMHDPLSRLLLQVIVIVLFARLLGQVLAGLGQPAVIGEMIAGIVLGPSLVGSLFPHAFQFVFPESSLGVLRMLSQVGVILFMFVVGMDLDVRHLGKRADAAVIVSHVSIVFPAFLGMLLALSLYRTYAPAHASFLAFALFMGTAMSITAFPVLARILEDRNLTHTFLGTTAITCAAVDDITAWSILAFVVALVKAGGLGASVMTILLSVLFVGLMLWIVRPLMNRLGAVRPHLLQAPTKSLLVFILIIVFSAALFTEVIGIHAIFGAFLAGIAMPADPGFRLQLKQRLENFSSAFLLPLFFAFTGLRTQIGLLDGWSGWSICGVIILAATFGKLVGSMATARWTGMNWRDAFALGALMNTRGLVELIVLNIGLDLGILSPQVFAMMVLMALVTTCLTGPLLSLAQRMPQRAPVGEALRG